MTDYPNGWTEDALAQAAADKLNADRNVPGLWSKEDREVSCVRTVMKLLAEHTKPPADPLLIEARKIVAEMNEADFPEWGAAVLAGEHDGDSEVTAALAGLKRGIELGKQS